MPGQPDSQAHDHRKAYVCEHVFRGDRPVLLVSRGDGDWCFLCGDNHPDDPSAYRVVGLGHVIDDDSTLEAILDLEPDEEAERSSVGANWVRSLVPPEGDEKA